MRLILALLVALPAAAQSPGSSFPADVKLGVDLVGHGLTAPLRWSAREWLVLPTAAAALAAVTAVDDDIQAFAQDHQGTTGDDYFGALEPFGEGYSLVVVVGLYAGGWVMDHPAARRTAVEAAAASVVAGLIVTPALKVMVGRARPRQQLGPYEFGPFGGDKSFPSGHTTQAFAVASVIAGESESLVVDVLAWGLAASVAGARIYHDAHFLSDVLAGAAIGTVVGRAMVREGRAETGSVEPFVGAIGNRVGLGLRIGVGPGGGEPSATPVPRRQTGQRERADGQPQIP